MSELLGWSTSACPKIRQNYHFERSEKSYSLIVLAFMISPFGRNDKKRTFWTNTNYL